MSAYIYFGNMSVAQIEREYCFEFTDEERARLQELQHQNANFKDGETGWHMFDIPRFLAFSNGSIGHEVLEIFQRHNNGMKGSFQGGYANNYESEGE